MESIHNDNETISLKKIIVNYLRQWKLFVIAACISLVLAICYITLYPQTYEIGSRLKIQPEKDLGSGGGFGLGEAAGVMKSFGLGGVSGGAINLDDEIATLSSNALLKRVVIRLGLNVSYQKSFSFATLYEASPLLVSPDSLTQENLDQNVTLKIRVNAEGKAMVKVEGTGEEFSFASLPAQLKLPEGNFDIFLKEGDNIALKCPFDLKVSVTPAGWMAEDLAEAITIDEFSKNANTLELIYTDYAKMRGKDLLNVLMEEYNYNSNSIKKEEGGKAMSFLDGRIRGILQELNNVEHTIETYKIKNKMTDIEYDVLFYSEAIKNLREKIIELEAQTHVVNLLDDYVKNPENRYNVIPSMLSSEGEKGGAISSYNEALMERDRIQKTAKSVNPLSEIADNQIEKLRGGVVLAIDNARKSAQFVLTDLKTQEKAIMDKMGTIPTFEREYLDYRRQQEILQGVYLILLQKREEVALSLGQERDKGYIIDAAVVKYRPIAPRKLFAVLGIILFTIIIPIGYLFAKQQLKDLMDVYKASKS